MSRKPGKYLRKVLILHAEWLKANGYPEQQATSCKQQATSYKQRAASLTAARDRVILSYKLKEKEYV
jgi:hypothetical protein|tara:strand:- start:744 stop:944 length:201 start_codon:yes stop_codon:yes gene_type:complete